MVLFHSSFPLCFTALYHICAALLVTILPLALDINCKCPALITLDQTDFLVFYNLVSLLLSPLLAPCSPASVIILLLFSLVSSHFTSPPSCPQHPRVMDHDIPTVSTNDKLALFYYFTLTALRWSTDHDHDYDIPDVSTNWNYFTILLGWPSAPPPGPPLTLTMSIAVIRLNVRQSHS